VLAQYFKQLGTKPNLQNEFTPNCTSILIKDSQS
jgi:hypothetical protein